jgi:hypothetical protein
MKKILFSCIAILTFATACHFKPTPNEGVEYNDMVIKKVNGLLDIVDDYYFALGNDSAESIVAREAFNKAIDSTIKDFEGLEQFDAKTEFKDVALTFARAAKASADKHLKRVCDIDATAGYMSFDAENWDALDEERTKAMEAFDTEYEKARKQFDDDQLKFAKEYGFEIKSY